MAIATGHRPSAAVAIMEELSDEAVPSPLFSYMPVARAGYDRILRCSNGRRYDLAIMTMMFGSFSKVFLVGTFPKLVLHRDAKIGAEATLEEKVELRQLSDEELSFFEGSLPDVLQRAYGLREPPLVTHHPSYSHTGHNYTSTTNPENVNGSNARWSRSYMQRLPLPSETFRS